MRTMYDAVNPDNLPDGGDLYAGYLDGEYVNVPAIQARFPGKRVVTISVNGKADADVIDVEKGNISPAGAVGWVVRQRLRGSDPSLYCPLSLWPTCRAAFQQANVPEPHYWLAAYGNDPTIPTGAVAKQWSGNAAGGYDISSVADSWPGIDNKGATMLDDADKAFITGHFSKAIPPGGDYEQGSVHYILRNRNYLDGLNDTILAHVQAVVTALPINASSAGVADPNLAQKVADELSKRLQA